MKELIKAIAVELVDHPDQVVVTEIASEHNCLIELRVENFSERSVSLQRRCGSRFSLAVPQNRSRSRESRH